MKSENYKKIAEMIKKEIKCINVCLKNNAEAKSEIWIVEYNKGYRDALIKQAKELADILEEEDKKQVQLPKQYQEECNHFNKTQFLKDCGVQ